MMLNYPDVVVLGSLFTAGARTYRIIARGSSDHPDLSSWISAVVMLNYLDEVNLDPPSQCSSSQQQGTPQGSDPIAEKLPQRWEIVPGDMSPPMCDSKPP